MRSVVRRGKKKGHPKMPFEGGEPLLESEAETELLSQGDGSIAGKSARGTGRIRGADAQVSNRLVKGRGADPLTKIVSKVGTVEEVKELPIEVERSAFTKLECLSKPQVHLYEWISAQRIDLHFVAARSEDGGRNRAADANSIQV